MQHSVQTTDGTSIIYQLHTNKHRSQCILIIHGFAEHSSRYLDVVNLFIQSGFHVALLDLRGHGLSTGKRGHIHWFADYLMDIQAVILMLQKTLQVSKVVLLGHSMGGLISIRYALEYPNHVYAMLLSAPLLGMQIHPSPWQYWAGKCLSYLWPSFTFPNQIDPNQLTHDAEKVKEYITDPLIFRHVTVRWYTEITKAIKQTIHEAHRIKVPFFLQLPEQECLVDNEQALLWYRNAKVKSKKLKQYPNLYHELYHETQREQVVLDGVEWIVSLR